MTEFDTSPCPGTKVERWSTWTLTAQTGEVKPSTAACIPSETKGTMFSPRRVSLYSALRMFRAWTWDETAWRSVTFSTVTTHPSGMKPLAGQTWGTVERSVFLSAEGSARAISSLMVIFSRLQLDDLGSEESKAWGRETQEVCFTLF